MISIHQSQFLPWLPYFYKVFKSDVFVVLDDVQFQKNGVQNRNQIKTPQGAQWLTVPVRVSLGNSINKTRIFDVRIYEKLLKTFAQNYKKAPFFEEVCGALELVFKKNIDNLHELNQLLFQMVMELTGITVNVKYSSTMHTTATKDDLVLEIIKQCEAKEYLSGRGALDYMDLGKFKKARVSVYVSKFYYAEYSQLWHKETGFIPDLSIIDLLFNQKDGAYNYIVNNGAVERII